MNARNRSRMVITALALMTILMPGCIPTAEPDCAEAAVFCVGLVTDGGDIRDRSYNQSAWEGLQKARAERLADWVEVIETSDVRDYARNIAEFAKAGYDVIVTAGSDMSEVTLTAANAHPDIFFIGVDQYQEWAEDGDPENDHPNLAGITFPEHQAGFLMGALAAMMTTTDQIGAVCSTGFRPTDARYCFSFKDGAAYIDPEIRVEVSLHDDVLGSEALSDPAWGAETAGGMVDGGVDIIFGVGGETGSSAIIAAVQRGAYGLGADFDQYRRLVEASPRLLSSGIKLIPEAILELLEKLKTTRKDDSILPVGNFQGQIGYAPFHDLNSAVPEAVKARMEEIRAGVASRKIWVINPAVPEPPLSDVETMP